MEWTVDDAKIKCDSEGYECGLIERTRGHMVKPQVESYEQIKDQLSITGH